VKRERENESRPSHLAQLLNKLKEVNGEGFALSKSAHDDFLQLASQSLVDCPFEHKDVAVKEWLKQNDWDFVDVCVCVCIYIYIYIYIVDSNSTACTRTGILIMNAFRVHFR
jgi:hypothetical protein